jgi:hypothetical protein
MDFSLFRRKTQTVTHASGVLEGRQAQREEERLSRTQFRQQELLLLLSRPLIIVPNEWCNPVIGFGKDVVPVGQSNVLVVQDYLSMEDVICEGVRMDFSDQRLEIVLTLDPYQLWAITAHNSVGNENFNKPKSGVRWTREIILQALENNGFFERWTAYRNYSRIASPDLASPDLASPDLASRKPGPKY